MDCFTQILSLVTGDRCNQANGYSLNIIQVGGLVCFYFNNSFLQDMEILDVGFS